MARATLSVSTPMLRACSLCGSKFTPTLRACSQSVAVDTVRAALAVSTATDRATLAVPQSYTQGESCSQRGSRHCKSCSHRVNCRAESMLLAWV